VLSLIERGRLKQDHHPAPARWRVVHQPIPPSPLHRPLRPDYRVGSSSLSCGPCQAGGGSFYPTYPPPVLKKVANSYARPHRRPRTPTPRL